MVRRSVHILHPLIRRRWAAALAATLVAAACSSTAPSPVGPFGAVVEIPPDRAAVQVANGVVSVVIIEPGRPPGAITASRAAPGTNSGHLYSFDGNTGLEWNTFFYGTAASDVARVEIDRPGAVGGTVAAGTWLIVLRDKGVTPDDLHWRFLDASGVVVASGSGVFPPEA